MISHRDIIQRFGGPAPLARLLNERCYQKVYNWKLRGIPARHWPRVIDAARQKGIEGITLEALAAGASAGQTTSDGAASQRIASAHAADGMPVPPAACASRSPALHPVSAVLLHGTEETTDACQGLGTVCQGRGNLCRERGDECHG